MLDGDVGRLRKTTENRKLSKKTDKNMWIKLPQIFAKTYIDKVYFVTISAESL
ncbi:hypothetical protein [uncultured Nitrosomonas sp.]|uniref:hypothetical protein n=1 Tax=uncultured Nitrosomonas sp. TaxID=156424 RepID=UPI0025ECB294|nr:hypothetical protein [uncultured Nitrosomonas sp.]